MQLLIYAFHNDETDILKYALQHSGLIIWVSHQIEHIKQTWTTQSCDAVLLISSGESAGHSVILKEFRSFTNAPIIVVTDPLSEEQMIELYHAGADLVVSRPYSLRILALQLRALILRGNNMPLAGLPSLAQGDLTLDPATRSVTVNAQPEVHLTQLEFRLLYTLMTHPGRILAAEELVEKVWGYPGESNRELVRGLVQRLRAKIEPDSHDPTYIQTEAGAGYYFRPTHA